ncbi:hypothetical protein SNE40_009793 [Patella caerulea]|uniref:Uncharacterized protein n=1 Tax=Patella caerulea TaxID=87958 RepID=A0AAN8PSS1_PATCE
MRGVCLDSTKGGLSRLNNDTVSVLDQGNGISSHDAPYVANTFQLQQQILEGKFVNFAVLLVPPHIESEEFRHIIDADGGEIRIKSPQSSKLNKPLSIVEYYKAYDIFRDVICKAFPGRQNEMKAYFGHITNMASTFGGSVFYEYHQAFYS